MYRERDEHPLVQETKPEKIKKDAIENEYNLTPLKEDLEGRGLTKTAELVGEYHLLSLKELFDVLGLQENIFLHLQEIRTIFNKYKKKRNAEDKDS